MDASQKIVAGDTLSFKVAAPTAADGSVYAASAGWTLTYRLIPRAAANSVIEINASADGDDYLVQEAAAATASWGAGDYGVAAYVTKAGETYTVEPLFAQAVIAPNPRTLTAGSDTRSQAQKAVDDLQAALAAYNASGSGSALGVAVKAYEIAGRRMEYQDLRELAAGAMQLLNFWQNQLAREMMRERAAKGLANPRYAHIRFAR